MYSAIMAWALSDEMSIHDHIYEERMLNDKISIETIMKNDKIIKSAEKMIEELRSWHYLIPPSISAIERPGRVEGKTIILR